MSPEAANSKLYYAAVFKKARDILSDEFGTGGVQLRLSQTGAQLLNVPMAEGVKRADAVAEKLRSVFAATDGVRFARPTKCAELRISGLDD